MQRGWPWARWLFVGAVIGAAGLAAAAASGRSVPVWAAVADLTALLAAIGGGVFLMGSGLFARAVLGAPPAEAAGRVALTFDDGPDPHHTRAVLDLLEARGHRATFFVIGAHAAGAPELLDEIRRRGHALGNHSFTHSYTLTLQSIDRITDDLDRAQAMIGPTRWFRPPVGLLSPRVAAAARRLGLELVGWSTSARDGARRATAEGALARLVRGLRPGAILVLHDAAERGDRAPLASAVLPPLLDELEARGLRSVTLDELLPPSAAGA